MRTQLSEGITVLFQTHAEARIGLFGVGYIRSSNGSKTRQHQRTSPTLQRGPLARTLWVIAPPPYLGARASGPHPVGHSPPTPGSTGCWPAPCVIAAPVYQPPAGHLYYRAAIASAIPCARYTGHSACGATLITIASMVRRATPATEVPSAR